LAGAEPSLFPALDNTTGRPEIRQQVLQLRDRNIHGFCLKNGLTIANFFQTIWALVLGNYLRADDVCFGYLSSGRDAPLAGVEDALGPCITMMVGRLSIDEKISLVDLARKVQENVTNGLAHQHCSLAEIQRELQLTDNLFNTMVDVQKCLQMIDSEDLSFRIRDVDDPTEFNLILNVDDLGDSVAAALTYWTTSLSDEMAKNLAETVSTAITQMLEKPQQSIGEIDLFSPYHADSIMEWNSALPPVTHCTRAH